MDPKQLVSRDTLYYCIFDLNHNCWVVFLIVNYNLFFEFRICLGGIRVDIITQCSIPVASSTYFNLEFQSSASLPISSANKGASLVPWGIPPRGLTDDDSCPSIRTLMAINEVTMRPPNERFVNTKYLELVYQSAVVHPIKPLWKVNK